MPRGSVDGSAGWEWNGFQRQARTPAGHSSQKGQLPSGIVTRKALATQYKIKSMPTVRPRTGGRFPATAMSPHCLEFFATWTPAKRKLHVFIERMQLMEFLTSVWSGWRLCGGEGGDTYVRTYGWRRRRFQIAVVGRGNGKERRKEERCMRYGGEEQSQNATTCSPMHGGRSSMQQPASQPTMHAFAAAAASSSSSLGTDA
ncbi:hypothetical protein CRG98_030906 [Punica granatum]|uniref:Uncharacterized protein n=1 Tax=Punica granatum TaxID=22663 RepID=A0A2I0IXD5_PUNGR|nr:hypothetical protein CRG98_030906 [Punica granatum]